MSYKFLCLALLLSGVMQAQGADHGAQLFEKLCSGCHTADDNKVGPRLRGVFGRKAGTARAFGYSDALKTSVIVWDQNALDKWLADPDKLAPGNNMEFQLQNPDERAAIIAYLKQLR